MKLKKPQQSFVDYKLGLLKKEFSELKRERRELDKYSIKNTKAIDKVMSQFTKWHKIKRESD